MHRSLTIGLMVVLALAASAAWAAEEEADQAPATRDEPLKVGEKAPALKVNDVNGKEVDLAKVYADGPTVLIMLRGYPGYQCPLCARQVAELRGVADKFKQAGAKVVMVYPGPAQSLGQRAEEFLEEEELPEPLTMVLDPDYKLTNAYGLRWDAPNETAYPSTFVIDSERAVKFAEVSKSHGGRVAAKTMLEEVAKSKEE